ncbi:MAG: TraR/DksA family transcriptional regulator [Gammaproteobacteria bacterium]|nr:TraR/DksA family transcriptional regulator [Gammaproteobacteria bacterium]
MVDYSAIRAQLLARRDELQARLDAVKRDMSTRLDQDFAEQAVELENGEVLAAIGTEAEAEIASINRALIRMDEGRYGACVDCGTTIPAERLAIRPYASRCVVCAEAHEHPGASL